MLTFIILEARSEDLEFSEIFRQVYIIKRRILSADASATIRPYLIVQYILDKLSAVALYWIVHYQFEICIFEKLE